MLTLIILDYDIFVGWRLFYVERLVRDVLQRGVQFDAYLPATSENYDVAGHYAKKLLDHRGLPSFESVNSKWMCCRDIRDGSMKRVVYANLAGRAYLKYTGACFTEG